MDEGRTRERIVKGTAASPRLDALGGLGFGVSRTRMAREIKAGRVTLNGAVVTDASKAVAVADIITLDGRGEVIVAELAGPTRKGRIGATLKRHYII